MSQDLFVCTLDLDILHTIYGSGNQKLLRKILRARKQQIADHDDYWGKQMSPYLPLSAAIQQIIAGEIDTQVQPLFQFEHAVALIADTLGEALNSDVFLEISADFWSEIDCLLKCLRRQEHIPKLVWPTLDELLKRGPFLKVPLDRKMPLGTGYLTASEVQKASEKVRGVEPEKCMNLEELIWPDEASEAVRIYHDWIREAAKKKLGLFFHC
jgi:hypothetical protein